MKREFGWEQITRDPASVVTVGTFDGVHLGHQAIVERLLHRAERHEGTSTVVSFDPHPRTIVRGDEVPLLTTVEERAAGLEALGLDRLVVIPFTSDFAQIEASDYVTEVLVEKVGMKEIVIGYDHGFGKGRAGDAALLEKMAPEHGFAVDVISAQEVEGYGVASSSTIRKTLIEEGDVEEAAAMLGRPYAVSGTVEEGDRRGREIGFPTANIRPSDPRKLVPRTGVYAVQAYLREETAPRAGMANLGRRPTFDGEGVRLEVHLLDFEGELYGESLHVEFMQRLRDEHTFDGPEALRRQLSKDRARCKKILTIAS